MDSKEGEKERENKNRDFITERRISGRMNVVVIKNTTDRCEFIPALYRFKFHSTRISRESCYSTKRILLNIPGTKPIHVTETSQGWGWEISRICARYFPRIFSRRWIKKCVHTVCLREKCGGEREGCWLTRCSVIAMTWIAANVLAESDLCRVLTLCRGGREVDARRRRMRINRGVPRFDFWRRNVRSRSLSSSSPKGESLA